MENIKYGRRREGRWTPIRAKAQDTRANPNSWETHRVRKRWDIGLLRALSPRIMMMMMIAFCLDYCGCCVIAVVLLDTPVLDVRTRDPNWKRQRLTVATSSFPSFAFVWLAASVW